MRPKARERPNTEDRLAGWRRVTQPGEICVVVGGPCRIPLRTVPLAWSIELLSCELLANPAADTDVLVLKVHKTPS